MSLDVTATRYPWWQRISLTQRLVATVLGTVALALVLSGGLALPLLRETLMQQKSAELSAAVERYDFGAPSREDAEGKHGPNAYYVAYRYGTVWARPESLPGTDGVPGKEALEALDPGPPSPKPREVRSEGGHTRWLATARTIDHGRLAGATAYVAAPLNGIDSTLARFRLGLLGLSLLVLPLAGLVGAFAVRRSLQPLREVEQVATAFGSGDTTRRVVGLAPQTEVGRVGESVNQMLDQIDTELAARQESQDRMRRFVGDASHELRTPLAAVRGFAELYRMGAVPQPEVVGVMRRIEDEAKRMGVLVEDLLLLARMDEQRPMQLAPVDLSRIARDATQDAHALAPDRQITLQGLDAGTPGQVSLIGDEAHLRQVVTNLVANAIRHTPKGSPIELQVGDRGGLAVFRVVDHGAGIPPEQQHKVFERFFRADASRSRATGGGSGLGLAIVAAITAAHHGHVQVVTTPGGGATFELAIPQTWQGNRDESPSSVTAVAPTRTQLVD